MTEILLSLFFKKYFWEFIFELQLKRTVGSKALRILCFQRYYYLTKQGQDNPAPNAMKCRHYSSEFRLCWQRRNIRNHCLVLNFTLQLSEKVTDYAFWYHIGDSAYLSPVFSYNDSQSQKIYCTCSKSLPINTTLQLFLILGTLFLSKHHIIN